MAKVYVSVGSNIEPIHYIRAGLAMMQQAYRPLTLSSVYESPAVGFEGNNFYNLVVRFETLATIDTVVHTLHTIEHAQGRTRKETGLSDRTLDLDLLLYDDVVNETLPRADIVRYAFVLLPLMEIAPEEQHPLSGQTYRQLWHAFDKSKQTLWRVNVAVI